MRGPFGKSSAAQHQARKALHRFGVKAPEHIRVEAFAARLGAEICFSRLEGSMAQLVRGNDRARIYLAERITDRAAQRFSIAHELGHLWMNHPSAVFPDPRGSEATKLHQRMDRDRQRECEREANIFAAELLMPSELVTPRCSGPISLAVAREISADFRVSILTSAIRVTELTNERCAVVLSERGTVRWAVQSPSFPWEIPRGRTIDRSSVAWDYFEASPAVSRLLTSTRKVPASAWIGEDAEGEIMEDAIGSPVWGTVLSMLWVPQDGASMHVAT